VAIVAHSFGGSLTILQAEKKRGPLALVIFSRAGYSWDRSPELRGRSLDAITRVRAPVFFIHATNDYSLNPGKNLTLGRSNSANHVGCRSTRQSAAKSPEGNRAPLSAPP
jgi:hypothetical protein